MMWWAEYTGNVFYHSTGLDPDMEDRDETGLSGWYFKLTGHSSPVGPYDTFEEASSCRRDFIKWEMAE